MTEGLVSRACAVEEQVVLMADQLARHDFVFTKIKSLCSTVQHHSESFEVIRKSNLESFDLLRTSMASQQAVMAEMMVKLQQFHPNTPTFSASTIDVPSITNV